MTSCDFRNPKLEIRNGMFNVNFFSVCTHLIVNGGREEDAVRLATWLLERCLSHESFTPHRRRLETWRLQVHALWQHTHHRQK